MSIKISMFQFAFFISFTFFISCENNRLAGVESHLNEITANKDLHGRVIIEIDTITSFEWDSLLVVSPYSFMGKISEKEGVDLNKIPNTIQSNDRFILIVFLHDNVGVKYIEVDRTKVLEQLLCDGKGYCIYPKKQSSFILKTYQN